MSTNINKILSFAIESNASDIHMSVGKKIVFRINGKLKTIDNIAVLDLQTMKDYVEELFDHNEFNIKKLYEGHDIDFAYIHESGTSFRINGFYKLGKISFVFRIINSKVKTMNELGLPPKSEYFTTLKQGLILVTGPTGSGKSTTMISLLEEINKTRGEHILTIEDPVEHVFIDDKSIFSQREIGRDTNSFSAALKSAVREDPNIIVIGEMRDAETVKAALELSETGHLVISTLHTSSSVRTIARLVNFFPLEHQDNIRAKIADNLVGVISQRLIPMKDNPSRVGIFELMFVNTSIRNLIAMGKLNQIYSDIETGMKDGMITMKKYAELLEKRGIIDKKDYEFYFLEESE